MLPETDSEYFTPEILFRFFLIAEPPDHSEINDDHLKHGQTNLYPELDVYQGINLIEVC